jgi:ubiquinol-cytochrome c reductase cytochrome b subunit
VHDLFGASVFLLIFSAVVFFAPEMGGFFLEHNNFLPADSMKTPGEIAPTWYFTPFYSVLRSTTADFMWVLMAGLAAYVVFVWLRSRLSSRTKVAIAIIALPWLDHSPAKSIRYRPTWHKYVYILFALAFVTLGFLGTRPPTPVGTLVGQACTLVYFSFFLLMPWWSTMGKFKPVPKRVTYHPH